MAALAAALGAGVPLQLLIFAIVSVATLVSTRGMVTRALQRSPIVQSNVNSLVGQRGVVTVPITSATGRGQIRVGGEFWTARPYMEGTDDIDAGSPVEVLAVEGNAALVLPLDGRSPSERGRAQARAVPDREDERRGDEEQQAGDDQPVAEARVDRADRDRIRDAAPDRRGDEVAGAAADEDAAREREQHRPGRDDGDGLEHRHDRERGDPEQRALVDEHRARRHLGRLVDEVDPCADRRDGEESDGDAAQR